MFTAVDLVSAALLLTVELPLSNPLFYGSAMNKQVAGPSERSCSDL